jgi:hypothetical protein
VEESSILSCGIISAVETGAADAVFTKAPVATAAPAATTPAFKAVPAAFLKSTESKSPDGEVPSHLPIAVLPLIIITPFLLHLHFTII